MNDRFITLAALVSGACLVAGLTVLVLAGFSVIRPALGHAGMALCVVGLLCHFHSRLDRMEVRERAAYELGRESGREPGRDSVRPIRG